MATGKGGGFSAEERAAMKERAKELKAGAGEQDLLDKIAEMDQPDRAMAERLHAIVREVAPQLTPRTWYGMPAYAKDGKVLCFFQPGSKFKTRYSTLGFQDVARLDDGDMWPVTFAITRMTDEVEARITEILRTALA
ncbi:MAG TPA: DUF1801 domain-containing protein [Actinomycetota bacterium]|nr:DUF1801 domain-containing protein [Actinomycetota bacterium]